MAARRFQAGTFVACSPEEAFEWIADYRNVPRVLEGVTRWDPVGRKTRGKGARFEVEMRTLGIPLTSMLEVHEWEPPRMIAWRSLGGLIEQEGAWEIDPEPDGVTVRLTIDYVPPAAAVGNILAAPVEALARRRLQAALDRMGEYLEPERESP